METRPLNDHERSEQAASTYLEQQIRSEDSLALIARVYEMATLHVARARAALAATDWPTKGIAVNKASRCISLLQCSLDMDKGKEVASNLDQVYGYLLRRLGQAHQRNDDAAFAEVQRHLVELGTAWRDAARKRGTEPLVSETAQPVARAAVGG